MIRFTPSPPAGNAASLAKLAQYDRMRRETASALATWPRGASPMSAGPLTLVRLRMAATRGLVVETDATDEDGARIWRAA